MKSAISLFCSVPPPAIKAFTGNFFVTGFLQGHAQDDTIVAQHVISRDMTPNGVTWYLFLPPAEPSIRRGGGGFWVAAGFARRRVVQPFIYRYHFRRPLVFGQQLSNPTRDKNMRHVPG